MKILCLNPPYFPKYSRSQRSPGVTKSGTLYYPMWLCYAAGALEDAGHEVSVVDAPAWGWGLDQVMTRAREKTPGLILLETSTPSIVNDLSVASSLKADHPRATVLVFGTHVTARTEETLSLPSQVDGAIRGELEQTSLEIARALETGKSLEGISGLSLRQEGSILHGPDRPVLEDLDTLPFVSRVYRKHLRAEDYFNPNALYPMVTIVASRGCPNQCTFCVYPQTTTGRRFRARSVDKVVEEALFIQDAFPQARSIFFEDGTFTADRDRCREISNRLREAGLKLSWTANARADLDPETLHIMKQGGCRLLCIGFESGDPEILKRIHKGVTPEQMMEFAGRVRQAGLLIHGCFMAGLPGETRESLNKTLRLAMKLKPDTAQFFPVMVYPGTEAYEWYQHRGWITAPTYKDWLTGEGLHNCVVRTEELSSEDIVAFCDEARRRFYLRPGYLWHKAMQSLSNKDELVRNLKASRTLVRYLFRPSIRQ